MWSAILSAIGPLTKLINRVLDWFKASPAKRAAKIAAKNKKARDKFKKKGRPK